MPQPKEGIELRYDGDSDRLELIEEKGHGEDGRTGLVVHASLELTKGKKTSKQSVQAFLALAVLLTGTTMQKINTMKRTLKAEYLKKGKMA
jgi:hypothetical protein